MDKKHIDSFEQKRKIAGVLPCDLEGERVPMILRHSGVKQAMKEWRKFSSDAPRRLSFPTEGRWTEPYFMKERPGGKDRGMNRYYHVRGIFRYDPTIHGTTKIATSDFTLGSRMAVGSMTGEATKGRFRRLPVSNGALSEEEMKKLHEAAQVEALK